MAEEGKTLITDGNILDETPRNTRSPSANKYFVEPINQVTNPIAHDRAMIRRLVEQARVAPEKNTVRGIVVATQEDISAADLIEFPSTMFFKKPESNDPNQLKKYTICYVRLLPEDANDDHLLELPNYLKQNFETGNTPPEILPADQDAKLISLHTKVLVQTEGDEGKQVKPSAGKIIYLKFVDPARRRAIMIGDGPIGELKKDPSPTTPDTAAAEKFATAKGLKQTIGDNSATGNSGGTRTEQDIEEWKTGLINQESNFAVPATGLLTSPKQKFRELTGRPHSGIDIGCPTGSRVVAMMPGKVSYVNSTRPDSPAGLYIEIDHSIVYPGFYTRYLHLSKPEVVVGAFVLPGDFIGYSGNTGKFTTGAHLHFELRTGISQDPDGRSRSIYNKGTATNPMPFLIQDPEFYDKLRIKSGDVYEKLISEEDNNLTEEQLHMWLSKSGLTEVDAGGTEAHDEYQSENDS